METEKLLIVFVKNPKAGQVKTRLAESIGEEKALDIYRLLLDHTCGVVKQVNTAKQVWYSGHIPDKDIWTLPGTVKKIQPEGNLGDRMSGAFRSGFSDGYEKIVLVGSDCLEIRYRHIANAFDLLQKADVVTGPSQDGGYYLLGMKKWHERLFSGKSWSTSSLYSETVKTVKNEKLSLEELDVLNDIDTLADLRKSSLEPNS
ncbi:MAG: TIGR04282 family arsenosugar biosynthesis glycosyltransferase [Balneolaceae bacterium]